MKPRIIIVDDEPKMVRVLAHALEREIYECRGFTDPREALEFVQKNGADIVFCDLRMPELDGIAMLDRIKQYQPQADFIIITAYASVPTAVEAMKKGAFDYLTKPVKLEEMRRLVKNLLETRELKLQEQQPQKVVEERVDFENFVAVSRSMKELLKKVRKVASRNTTVLLQGESGTGKEILANIIHNHSPRREAAFICVNCGAIPETLLESELFGYVKGAFTGAYETRKGIFQQADAGTLFLDEIAELSSPLQVKLLRVLQSGEVQRIGDYSETITVDVRIIAATNKRLDKLATRGQFRQDLYYRLSVFPIHIPLLRERREDLPALIEFFLRRYGEHDQLAAISQAAYKLLEEYSWPGNVRELENAIEHALVMCEGKEIKVQDLPLSIQQAGTGEDSYFDLDHLTLEQMEKKALLNALRKTGFNYTRAARILGITRRTLTYRVKKYDLEKEGENLRGEEQDT